MNLRNVNLNLLVVLDALLEDRHVTRAALRIGLSQPATSNALTRLRQIFDDELLVRTPSGMKPTERALGLAQPVRRILRDVERVLERDSTFRPAASDHTFRVRMGDLHDFLFLPAIMAALGREAPGVKLNVVHLTPADTVDALMKDDLDLAISLGLEHPQTIRSADFCKDRLVCAMRRDHPAAGRPLTLETYLELRHIRIAQSPSDRRFVDDELARRNVARSVPLQVQHWLAAPELVRRTDLVSSVWQRMAARFTDDPTLLFVPLPFGPRSFTFRLYWHRRYDSSAAHAWLRAVVAASAQPGGDASSGRQSTGDCTP